MGNITWTKSWSASDNGTVLGGADIQNIQNDITTVVNGGLTNANVNATAAIVESKIAFDTSAGHDHDGTDSKLVFPMKHWRRGMGLKAGTTADSDIKITPGSIDMGGLQLITVADSSDIDISSAGNWVNGAVAASMWCYVYVYNNSGSAGFKLSAQAPDLSFDDDTTAEYPLRYQAYSAVYYRCLGAVFIDAAGDLCWGQASSEGKFVSQFDASNVCIIGGKGTGSDQTFSTIWTPKYGKVIYGKTDTIPATTEDLSIFEVTNLMLDSNWAQLNAMHEGATHDWIALTTAGSINAVTDQSAGTAGSFTIDAMTDGEHFYAYVMTDVI